LWFRHHFAWSLVNSLPLKVFPCFRAFFVFCFTFHHMYIVRPLVLALIFISLNAQGIGQQRKVKPQAAANEGQQRTDNQNPQPQVIIQSQPNQQPASGDRKQHRFPLSPEWVTAISTVLIFFATSIYAIVSYCILGRMGHQAHEMKRQRAYMRLQWKAMRDQVDYMRRELGVSITATRIANRTALAARDAAKATQRSVDAFIAKERASLYVRLVEDGDEDDEEHRFNFANVETIDGLSNIGSLRFSLGIYKDGPSEARNVRLFGSIRITHSIFTPPLGEAARIHEVPNTLSEYGPFITYVDGGVTQSQIDGIVDTSLFAHLFGYVAWNDIFGNPYTAPFRYIWRQVEDENPPYFVSEWHPVDEPNGS
jgi:hypothetical protein